MRSSPPQINAKMSLETLQPTRQAFTQAMRCNQTALLKKHTALHLIRLISNDRLCHAEHMLRLTNYARQRVQSISNRIRNSCETIYLMCKHTLRSPDDNGENLPGFKVTVDTNFLRR